METKGLSLMISLTYSRIKSQLLCQLSYAPFRDDNGMLLNYGIPLIPAQPQRGIHVVYDY